MTDPDFADVPDAFDPSQECGAWRPGPRVIGGPSHTHHCRRFPDHDGYHRCMCGADFTSRGIA